MSPTVASDTKRIKTSRTSLPASLSQDPDVDPHTMISEWKFSPLHLVLERYMDRIRQRSQANEANDVTIDDEMELADDDMLVLDSQDEIEYPQLPTPTATPLGVSRRIADNESEDQPRTSSSLAAAERERFHDAIIAFQKRAEEATANYDILSIEVQSLGFEGDDALAVLQSIRDDFDGARKSLELELPGSLPEDASNRDILDVLVADVKEFADRLRTADKELLEKSTLNTDLGNQVHNLVKHLAEKKLKTEQLLEEVITMEETNEKQVNDNRELEDRLTKAENDRNMRQADVDAELERSNKLEEENSDLTKSVERLAKALEDYRSEEKRLTDLVNKKEDEHRTIVANMNKERENTVREMEDSLDAEIEHRSNAEKLAVERQANITQLQAELEDTQLDRDALIDERDNLQTELDKEETDHENTQTELDDKLAAIEDLETRIEGVEGDAEQLQEQLNALRQQHQTERQQREAAEQELDNKQRDIDELDRKLQERGKEANALRLQAHDVQAKNQQRITQLEEQMSERDAQFQSDMADEVKRREDAEGLSQERAAEGQDLRDRLAEVEAQMRNLLAERDARIEELEEQLAQRDTEIQTLQDELQHTQDQHTRDVEQRDARIEELDDNLAARQTEIEQYERRVADLQQEALEATELHDSQTDERDNAIQNLNHRIAALTTEIEDLKKDKASLEKRVQHEAEQMLEVSVDYQNKIDDLEDQLKDTKAHIEKVTTKAREAERLSKDTLEVVKRENVELENVVFEKNEVIAQQTGRIDHLRTLLRRSMDAAGVMRNEVDRAQGLVADEEQRLREDLIGELEGLDVPDHQFEDAIRVEQAKTKAVKKVKGRASKGRRVVDSGIGLEDSMLIEG